MATRKPGHVTTVNVSDIAWFEWVNDDRLVFTIIDRQVGAGAQRGSGLYTVKRDGSEFRVLARPPTIAGQFVYRYTQMLAPLRDGSDVVIVVANDANHRYPDVYRLDTGTGKKSLVSLGKPGDVVQWLADRQGRVRIAVTEEPGGKARTYWRASEDDALAARRGVRGSRPAVQPVAFDGDGSLVVASAPGGQRHACAATASTPSPRSSGDLLAAHPEVDLGGRPRLRPTARIASWASATGVSVRASHGSTRIGRGSRRASTARCRAAST